MPHGTHCQVEVFSPPESLGGPPPYTRMPKGGTLAGRAHIGNSGGTLGKASVGGSKRSARENGPSFSRRHDFGKRRGPILSKAGSFGFRPGSGVNLISHKRQDPLFRHQKLRSFRHFRPWGDPDRPNSGSAEWLQDLGTCEKPPEGFLLLLRQSHPIDCPESFFFVNRA